MYILFSVSKKIFKFYNIFTGTVSSSNTMRHRLDFLLQKTNEKQKMNFNEDIMYRILFKGSPTLGLKTPQ